MSDSCSEKEVLDRALEQRVSERTLSPSLNGEMTDLLKQHQDRVYRLCLGMVRSPERAQELTQETMLIAWRRLPSFNGSTPFKFWLYGIARNLCRRHREKRAEFLSEDGLIDPSDHQATDALARMRYQERIVVLMAAAEAVLEPIEQEAVYLRYVEGMSQEAITTELELTSSTGARGMLQRCRRKLKRELRRRLLDIGHQSSFFHDGSS